MIWLLTLIFLVSGVSLQENVDYNNSSVYLWEDVLNILAQYSRIPEDFGLNIFDFLRKYGYLAESHNVTTEDGYILGLHRIPNGRNDTDDTSANSTKPVILLMHGLSCSSMNWVHRGPGKSLGLVLADAGYDVWIGNNRGNSWSRQHETLDPDNDTEFWNFSFHEFGYYDVPALIDYILETTGNDQLYYVGHSQGTSQFFAMTSTRPEYNKKVAHMTALAPIAYLHRQTSKIPRFLADNLSVMQIVLKVLRINDILRPSDMFKQWIIILCGDGSPFQELCAQLVFFIGGEDSPQLDRSWLPVMLSVTPDDTSIKTFVHLLQLIRTDSFQQFDYGIEENKKRYGNPSPPAYNVHDITVPIAIYFAQNDPFNSRQDVDKLVSLLPNIVKFYTIEYKKFTHLDYLMAKDTDTLLNNELVQYLNEISSNIQPNPDDDHHKNQAGLRGGAHTITLLISFLSLMLCTYKLSF